MIHLIAHEDAELHLELAFGLDETPGDRHHGRREDAFEVERAEHDLQVGRKAEGHGFRVMQDGLTNRHTRNQFGTPDAAGLSRDEQLMRKARVHVHDVGHESQGGKMVGEGAAEEPEVVEGGEGGAEVVLDDCVGNIFLLNGGEGLQADAVCVIQILLLVC